MKFESINSTLYTGQLQEDGTLGPVKEACINRAERIFQLRHKTDTNPKIVQMILRGERIPHWYYRSDEWIDQPYFAMSIAMQPYVESTNKAPIWYKKEGNFMVDDEATNDFIKFMDMDMTEEEKGENLS